MKLEPGWLARTMYQNHIQVMADSHPEALAHLGIKPQPETDEVATELARKMADRFQAWIGRPITDFL